MELQALHAKMQACGGHLTKLSCEQASGPKCVWETLKGACAYDPNSNHLGALVMSTFDCGWLTNQLMVDSQCEAAATEAECAATGKCIFENEWMPNGTVCSQHGKCMSDSEDSTSVWCGDGFDEDAVWESCYASVMANNPVDEDDFNAQMVDCYAASCPLMGEIVMRSMECYSHDSADECNSQEKCYFEEEGNYCEVDTEAILMESIPAGCPYRDAMVVADECEQKPMSQCTGRCEWMESKECEDAVPGAPTVRDEAWCEPSMITIFEVFAQAGSADAQSVLRAELVSENCRSQKTPSDCQDGVYQTTTPTATTTSAFKLKLKLKVKGKSKMRALLKVKIVNGHVEAKAKVKAGRRRG
jgi:hypothetical protein